MEKKVKVAILGATGSVGQKLVSLLNDHPWFEIGALAASERSEGRLYRDVVRWLEPTPLPVGIGEMVVTATRPPLDCAIAFSALDAGVAREVEPVFARAGIKVISNASAFRDHPQVPLVIPEVNPDHMALVHDQEWRPGFIVTNPNCVVVGLAVALKPLVDAFGIEAVEVTSMQAISGAGYPGVPSLDIMGNVIPYIQNEEDKIQTEPGKILGTLVGDRIEDYPVKISAQATRVPVLDGHTLSVSVKLHHKVDIAEVAKALTDYSSPIAGYHLPSAPQQLLWLTDNPIWPQPRLHSSRGGGMTVSIGRLRPCPVQDVRFVALVHNTVRGAAGAAILNAELAVAQGLVITK